MRCSSGKSPPAWHAMNRKRQESPRYLNGAVLATATARPVHLKYGSSVFIFPFHPGCANLYSVLCTVLTSSPSFPYDLFLGVFIAGRLSFQKPFLHKRRLYRWIPESGGLERANVKNICCRWPMLYLTENVEESLGASGGEVSGRGQQVISGDSEASAD